MKKLTVPQLNIPTQAPLTQLAQAMQTIAAQPIEELNWIQQYPTKPRTSFRIAHNNHAVLLQYTVHEEEIRATITHDNGEVWTDSCVEFFISFDHGKHYYNAEFSCIGKALLGYRKTNQNATHASPPIMQTIRRLSTLGNDNIPPTIGRHQWTLTLAIPITAFWQSHIKSLSGVQATANFYKCGDKLSLPHYISWSPIQTPTPSFHQPDFFGHLLFQ